MKTISPREHFLDKIILYLGLCFISSAGLAQQFVFSSYSLEQGLSQSVVNCMLQDSKGFLWVGTQNGLNRFNGYDFEVFTYNPNDSNTISNNWIYAIDEDSAGNLWIGTKGGLNEYIRGTNQFRKINYTTPFHYDVTDYTYDVLCMPGGNILINTPPVLSIYNPEKQSFAHHVSDLIYDGAVKDNTMPLLLDHKGLIWMGSTRGLACFDPKKQSFSYFTQRNIDASMILGIINDMAEDKHGNLWIATSVGLDMIRRGGGSLADAFEKEKSNSLFSGINIRALLFDKSGKLWMGAEGRGLLKLSLSPANEIFSERFTADDNGLNHNIVLSLALDQSDNLWVGTLSGLNKTDLKKPRFQLYRNSLSPNSVNLLGNVIASLYKDKGGLIWVGNWGQGLNCYDRKTGLVRHFSTELGGTQKIPNDYVHTIFGDDKNRMWIGTRDGLLIYHPGKQCFLRPADFFNDKRLAYFRGMRIFKFIQDKSLNYWVATQNGLFLVNHDDFSTIRFYKEAVPGLRLSANLVYSLLEDKEGSIWIATIEGLDVWNPRTRTLKHFKKIPGKANSLCDNFVTALCEDVDGNIWIGTNSYMNKFVKKDSNFVYYSKANGLPNNLIYSLLEDNLHNIWVATGNGLARFNRDTGKFRTYSVRDGLQSPEFNVGVAFRSADGELFFGGMNGFNSFYPDSLKNNPNLPPIAITAFYKTTKGDKVFLDPESHPDIILRYNEYPITIEFAALEYTNPEENHYAYKLEGIDKDWIDINNRRFVSFSNLPPGEYTFHVKCANNDGIWNEAGESLKITIRPPWWRSSLAILAYVLLIAGSFYLYVKMRERQYFRTRRILEEKVLERTKQIETQKIEILEINEKLRALNASKDKFFSIIAHDLRNPFNAIIGLTDILLGNITQTDVEKLQRTLTNIKNSSAQAHELLENLLLWARNQTGGLQFSPQQLNFRQLVMENIALADSQAAKKNIRLTTDIKLECLLTGDPNMVNTIIRNLLTNAIKFTPQNGNVSITLTQENANCFLIVSDTGIGITPERIETLFSIETKHKTKGTEQEPGTGLGLIICKEFIEKHGGKIEVKSIPGEGSMFTVVFPNVQLSQLSRTSAISATNP